MTQPGDDRRYIRAIEAAWSRFQGRPAVVSPREFETLDSWRRRGIPLAVILEAIEAIRKRRAGKAPRSLTALAGAVEDAWSVVAAGRSAAPDVAIGQKPRAALQAWEDAVLRSSAASPLRTLLTGLLEEARAGRDAPAVDAALDGALGAVVPGDLLERARRECARQLEPFRSRMSDGEFRKMIDRALVDRLRSELVLPRLALDP